MCARSDYDYIDCDHCNRPTRVDSLYVNDDETMILCASCYRTDMAGPRLNPSSAVTAELIKRSAMH